MTGSDRPETGNKGERNPGEALIQSDDDHDYIELPDVIGGQEGDFMIQLGVGMENAAILSGDYVLARRTDGLDEGALVVAVLGEAAAAGIFEVVREADHVWLRSENKTMAAEEANVLGLVIGVLRKVSWPRRAARG